MEISYFALGVLGSQAVVWFLLGRMSKMGRIRAGGISGWFAGLVGLTILAYKKMLPVFFGFDAAVIIGLYGGLTIIATLLLLAHRDNPSVGNIPILREAVQYLPRIGILMGLVMTALRFLLK